MVMPIGEQQESFYFPCKKIFTSYYDDGIITQGTVFKIIRKEVHQYMYAVIMAGGKGTRISSVRSDLPKPMIPVCNKPILEHQMEVLKRQGVTDLILAIGHMGEIIRQYFGSGEAFGVSIRYVEETQPLGTAGALYELKDFLTEDFLLVNGDLIFDVDIEKMASYHKIKGGIVTILTHPNNHPYDSGLIICNKQGQVEKWLTKEEERLYYRNCVNAGIHMLSPKVFRYVRELKKMDLDRDILKKLIPLHQLYAYASPEYVMDMGTPDRYAQVENDLRNGKVQMKNLCQKQRAVFLDRDGTLNIYQGFIKRAEDIALCPGAVEAVRLINHSGYLAIVISNQPVIARGEASFAEVDRMMDKIETLLGEGGAYLDDRFYCPHHPDSGYDGEISELKIKCSCRKPEPGLLYKAAEKYHIDLKNSYMIGDSMSDVLAGERAGCTSFLLDDQKGNAYDYKDLLACIQDIFGYKDH